MLSTAYARTQRSEDGFTLIELLIVVIIIGILAAIALPIFIDQSKVAVDASVQSDVRNSVTNITNAQAQEATTAKAAVSNADTKVALTAVGRSAAAGSAATTVTATKASAELTNVPALGGEYTVQGYNAGGKKYQGAGTNLNGKAFGFDSTTGKFTQVDTSASAGGSGTGGGSNSAPAAIASWDLEGTIPSGVAAYPSSGASLIEVADAHSGTHVYSLPGNSHSAVDFSFAASNFEAGKTYTFSVWVRGAGSVVTNPNDGQSNVSYTTALTDQWQKVTNTYTAPASGPVSMYFSVYKSSYYNPAVQFDDLSLTKN